MRGGAREPVAIRCKAASGRARERPGGYSAPIVCLDRRSSADACAPRRAGSDFCVFTSSATLNNKIHVLQRCAYGLRDEEYLRLKILTCMLPAI